MATTDHESNHSPVMVDEVVKLLITDPEGIYVDLTVGTGGHLRALAEALSPRARLYGLDIDEQAVELTRRNLAAFKSVIKIVKASYSEIDSVVSQIEPVSDRTFTGGLLDGGLSSRQLDDPARGFSFVKDGPLDMRFDPQPGKQTAADLIATLSEPKLAEIIKAFGEERLAPRIAAAIVGQRHREKIRTTGQLARIVRKTVNPPHQTKSLARVFQALRIAVNCELEELQQALPQVFGLLKIKGRLAVISYHSLEDRIVKQYFRSEVKGCVCPPELPVCVCQRLPRARLVTRKALTPSTEETERNPRSRSAKLRVVERIAA